MSAYLSGTTERRQGLDRMEEQFDMIGAQEIFCIVKTESDIIITVAGAAGSAAILMLQAAILQKVSAPF